MSVYTAYHPMLKSVVSLHDFSITNNKVFYHGTFVDGDGDLTYMKFRDDELITIELATHYGVNNTKQ